MIRYAYRKVKAHRARKAEEVAAAIAPPRDPMVQSPTLNPPIPTVFTVSKKPCPKCAQEKSAARKYRWKLLFCLVPAFFVSSLDLTIVATALPRIASHFDRFNQLNWIVTAFTLTSTAFIPVWGQLADIFGRHATLQCAVVFLTIGSILCAAAPDWAVLLLGRALQGVGTAGVSNVVLIILADSVSLKEQAVNTSIFQLMNGVGYSVGPVIGGYITNANWRYCFVLGAGISAVSLLTVFLLRKELKGGHVSLSRPPRGQTRLRAFLTGISTVDFGGIAIFIFGVGLVILGTAWGGSTYAWSSGAVLSSLVIGAILILVFLAYEALLSPSRLLNRLFPKTVPMIPGSILSAKDVSLVCCIAASAGAALYSVFYFIGIYFTLVEAYEASDAGVQLLYYVPGLGVGVYSAILICNVWPRQTFWPLLVGTIVETAGIATLAYAVKARDATLVNVMMAVAGAGTGLRFMPSNLHLAGMFRDRLAPVYSLLRFALPFGGTLALIIMGSVFQNQMSDYFGSDTLNSGNNGISFNLHDQDSLDAIAQLPDAEQAVIRSQGATATMWAFISILPILGLGLLASAGLGNVWIAKSPSQKNDSETGERREDGMCRRHANSLTDTGSAAETPNEVEYISSRYLLALFRGNVQQLKRAGVNENAATGPSAHQRRELDASAMTDGSPAEVEPKEFGGTVSTRTTEKDSIV
ncbi:hypothetical protein A1O1_03600 [Capronia coronata CBS 617.96]|uniref:Major facilitator superfamily (MFS) profile domain-containing protein n=1 Tax=Capronia coronata CBS 617.96 TaxID=1182541 RepID=W9YC96_9EURO|nr:uncharacterized protein A1O1_03600 [Capronia coronata CBS 617.96]EXJ90497.1 hypothetical protein A1O1_03600 [Capronia coronata CBS 617.96]